MDHTRQPVPDTPEDQLDDIPFRVSKLSSKSGTHPGSIREDDEAEEEEPDETTEETVQQLAEDVQMCYQNKTPLYDTYFYKVVLAGNVEVVKRTIEYLEVHCDGRVVSWLLDIGCAQHRKMYTPITKKKWLKFTRWVVFIFSAIVSMIISPIFYCVHGLSYTLLEHRKRYLSNRVTLPLAFAAFSHSVEMVEYFLRKNVRAMFSDNRFNNVFHYIGDLSAEASSNACTAFDVVMEALDGESDEYIKGLLFEHQNTQGLSALEYTARYGSPALLTKMMNYQNLMRRTQFGAKPKCVILRPAPKTQEKEASDLEVKVDATQNVHVSLLQEDKEKAVAEEKAPSNGKLTASPTSTSLTNDWGEATTRVDFVDVTMYESHSLTKRSLLLRLIGSRSIGEITINDLRLFQKCPVVGKWIKLKVAEMTQYIVVFHILDIIVTILLLALLAFLKGSLPYQLQESQNFFRAHVGEVVARSKNESKIITGSAMRYLMQETIQNKQVEWSIDKVPAGTIEDIFRNNTHSYGPEYITDIGNVLHKNKTMGHDLPPNIKGEIIEKAFADMAYSTEKLTFQNLFVLTVIFSREFLAENPDYHLIQPTEKNVEMLEESVTTYFYNFETEIQGQVLKPSNYFDEVEWRSLFCPDVGNLTLSDFLTKVTVPPPPSEAMDICQWQSLVNMAEKRCKPNTPVQVYKTLEALLQLSIDHGRVADGFVYIMLVFAVGYILIDTFEHLRFFYTCVQANSSSLGMTRSLLTWRIPGSYYRKQLNVITYYVLIIHVCVQADMVAMYFSNAYIAKLTHQMLLIGLCLRFIMHVHSLRLFPWIGHFVITTFRMATNLIHFSTVLGVVIFIFGLIFHILIVDEDCPIRKAEGFTSVGISMFSVFKLTFGHGDFDAYYTSTPVMLTYALFTIICGLLLLNLIIAIMSTTAMDLMTAEGKEALTMLEWLNESLAAEYTVTALAGSCSKHWLYKEHRKLGYVITTDTKKPKVYIRVFYCPKLD